MNKQEKIEAIAQIMRELKEENYDGELEILLAHTRLREMDSLNYATIGKDGKMRISAVSELEEYNWEEPIENMSDEDIDKIYDDAVAHKKWVETH